MFLVSGPAGRAEAQTAWLADRSRAEGPGIRVGDFELHPGVGVEIGWDSNLYFTEDNPDPARRLAPKIDTAILRVTPHFLFSTLGPQRREEGEGRDTPESKPTATFRGGLAAAYYEFFADPNRRNLELNGSLRLVLFPDRPFSFSIWDNFIRGVRPFTENFNPQASHARISNQAGLDLFFQTDGGMFQVRTAYAFGLDYFEGSIFQYANSFNHDITLQETFRFLPQSAIVHDTVVSIRDYYSEQRGPSLVQDNVRVRSRLGFNGALSETISAALFFGYGAGFFPQTTVREVPYDQDYDSIVAQAELQWRITETMNLRFGYDRDMFPSVLGNYYSRDRGYIAYQMLISGVFLLSADFDISYVDFGAIRGGDPSRPFIDRRNGEREDVRVGAGLFGELRFTDWFGINATFRYTGQFTDYRFDAVDFVDPASFNKVELFLGARVFY
ncbi:MAG: hypothetical protein NZM37_11910 [Sandaracinaceae bacterium]|nr:hypothetical protein [Sandaracinaceae bacterium]